MDSISSDAESASGSDDDDGTASEDGSQPNIVEEADDNLSDGEAGGYDRSVPFGWMSQSPVSRERFAFTGDAGVKVILEDPQNPLDIFLAFVDDDIIEYLVSEINRYAAKVCEEKRRKGKMRRKSRDLVWKETNVGEMYTFIGLAILQGIVRKPTIYSYHSTNQLLATPFFGKCMSRDRFGLLKYLHLSDKEDNGDPAFKFREILDMFRNKFQSNYIPEENISMDESLLLWKGRLSWKRYIPLKRARFGMETYILAEAESGYVWDVLPYTGKNTQYDCTRTVRSGCNQARQVN